MSVAAVFALAALASLIAFTPVAAAIDRPFLMVYVVIAVAIGFGLEAQTSDFKVIRTYASARPSVAEFALAGGKALQVQSTIALLALGVYYLIWWSIRGLDNWFTLTLEPGKIAFIVTLVVVFIPVMGVAMVGAEEIAKTLYPLTAGIPSGFYVIANHRQRLIVMIGVLALIVLAGATILMLLLAGGKAWIALGFLWSIFVLSSRLEPTQYQPIQDQPPMPTIEAATEAFKALGYIVVPFPRSRQPDIDPLLLDVDLLVYMEDGNDGLSIDIKQRSGAASMDWTTCSALVTAARALETAIKGAGRVHPVMMLVDASADDSFRAFSKSESVAFVVIDTRKGTVEVRGAPENHDLHAPADDILARLTGRAAPSGDGAGTGTDVPAEQAR